MNGSKTKMPSASSRTDVGFTALELLAVLATLALFACVMATTMAGTRVGSAAVHCRNNLKQLTAAWTMYADDNRGQLVYNTESVNAGKDSADRAWVAGWLDFTSNTDNTNASLLIDHVKYPYGAFLGPYVRTARVFKCPSDQSSVSIGGVRVPRVRSVSLNNYLGTGSRTWTSPSRYLLCSNMAQVKLPAGMFVVLDERSDSILSGCFFSDPDTQFQLIRFPGNYHDGGGNFSFVDGHTEIHRWIDPRTAPVLYQGVMRSLNQNLRADGDVAWIQQRAAGVAKFP